MNRIVLNFPLESKKQTLQVTDPFILQHIHQVLKSQVGDELKITLLNQGLATGRILDLTQTSLSLKLTHREAGLSYPLHLMIALSRPPSMKKILEHGTTLGASSFQFFQAHHSEKSYADSKIFKSETIDKLLRLGLAQSKIFYQKPKVSLGSYPQMPDDGEKFILSNRTSQTLSEFSWPMQKNVTFAIGPERGFTNDEIDLFGNHGFKEVSLGPSTLRVEHACFAAMAQWQLLRQML